MPKNPRLNPKTDVIKYGEHAISLGEAKLGYELDKCMREVALIYDLPDQATKDMMMRKLYANIRSLMGLPTE